MHDPGEYRDYLIMQGRRVDRIEEQLRIEISEIVEREIQDPRVHFVTTTRVKVTPDLGHARVFITVLGTDALGGAFCQTVAGEAAASPPPNSRVDIRIRRDSGKGSSA
jgi:ribosome-binding factor A